jgi:uncharacterized protein
MLVESPLNLLLGLVSGVAFGFLLHKGGVAKYSTVVGQLLLRDWTVLKVMLTAIVIGSIGVYALVAMGAAHLDIWPFEVGAVLVGAVVFGVGLALFGYCPGTSIAASGAGHRDAMVGVAGMLTGAIMFVVLHPAIEPIEHALGDLGKVTIPELLHIHPAVVIVVLAVIALALFAFLERKRLGLRFGERFAAR